MKITTTTNHDITFAVEAFTNTEGGMDHENYGDTVHDLPSAIRLLELARVAQPKEPWVIVCDVKTVTQ